MLAGNTAVTRAKLPHIAFLDYLASQRCAQGDDRWRYEPVTGLEGNTHPPPDRSRSDKTAVEKLTNAVALLPYPKTQAQ
jgi:hypothetical protein